MAVKTNQSNNKNTSFNYDLHITELNDRFYRLIKQLGSNNEKGSKRYELEVDFAYALHEIKICPPYLQGKMFDKASGILSSLINMLRLNK